MDPISISASVIALLGAVEAVGKGLRKVLKLRTVPTVVLALHNEISDLRLILHEADSLLLEYRKLQADSPDISAETQAGLQSLPSTLSRGRSRIADLQTLLDKHLTDSSKLVDRLSWLKEEADVRRIHENVRRIRADITASLGLLSSSTSVRVQIQLQELRLVTESGYSETSRAMVHQKSLLEEASASARRAQEDTGRIFERIEHQLLAISEQVRLRQAMVPLGNNSGGRLAHRLSDHSASKTGESAFAAIQMRFHRRPKCPSWCRCACHAEQLLHSPRLLRSVIGLLYVGHAGVPKLSPPCDNRVCLGNSAGLMNIHYVFPQWLVARAISVAMSFAPAGPEICIRILNVRGAGSPIFSSAYEGDTETVRHLLVSKKASVLDIEADSGQSPLHFALFRSNMETVSLLIQHGAERHQENSMHETPDDMAWNSILCFQSTPKSSLYKTDALLETFSNSDVSVERRQLTRVHKIVLQILHIDLEEELRLNPALVDQPDSDGRTPLHWAAARGDSAALRLLLKYGADPNYIDRISQGPLRSSMKATDPSCMKLLLNAGAIVDQRDRWEQTPLQSAMYYPHPEAFVVPLLDAGADIDALDHSGTCPLTEAVRNDHPEVVRIFLSRGCNHNTKDNWHGMTPFQWAIYHNRHEILSTFLEHNVNYQVRDKLDRTVLHIAAEFGDIETLRLLTRSHMREIDVRHRSVNGQTALDTAESRCSQDSAAKEAAKSYLPATTERPEWSAAFVDLVRSIVGSENMLSAVEIVQEDGSDCSDDTGSYHSAFEYLVAEVVAEPHDLVSFVV